MTSSILRSQCRNHQNVRPSFNKNCHVLYSFIVFFQPALIFASITLASDLNDVHHIAVADWLCEGILQMSTSYTPQLGPAPRWASFLENITEVGTPNDTFCLYYEDYQFLGRNELKMCAYLFISHWITFLTA